MVRREEYPGSVFEEDMDIGRGKKKEKGSSKLDRKKKSRLKADGLVPEPELKVEQELNPEPEIKVEMPEQEPKPELVSEKKPEEQAPKIEAGAAARGDVLEEKIELIAYKDFANKINSLQTMEDLLEYLSSLGEFKLRKEIRKEKGDENKKSGRNEEYYFPAFFNRVKEVFAGKFPSSELKDIPVLQDKVWEILEKEKDIESQKNNQEKKKPNQKDADIDGLSSKVNGKKGFYAKSSIHEDAKDEDVKIKSGKIAQDGIEKTEEKEEDTETEDEKKEFEGWGKEYWGNMEKAANWDGYSKEQKLTMLKTMTEVFLKKELMENSEYFKEDKKAADLVKKIVEKLLMDKT